MVPETFYHIYNRGNNKQDIFPKRENYLYFLKKIRKHLMPHLDVVAYCLMPNHFHILAYTKSDIVQEKFSEDLKIMLRSYTRAINKQENKTGSLFQQNTKKKVLGEHTHGMTPSHAMSSSTNPDDYPFICFHYIHQNPVKAGLVREMEEWEMSSYKDYVGLRDGTLCTKSIAHELLEIPSTRKEFIEQSQKVRV